MGVSRIFKKISFIHEKSNLYRNIDNNKVSTILTTMPQRWIKDLELLWQKYLEVAQYSNFDFFDLIISIISKI